MFMDYELILPRTIRSDELVWWLVCVAAAFSVFVPQGQLPPQSQKSTRSIYLTRLLARKHSWPPTPACWDQGPWSSCTQRQRLVEKYWRPFLEFWRLRSNEYHWNILGKLLRHCWGFFKGIPIWRWHCSASWGICQIQYWRINVHKT